MRDENGQAHLIEINPRATQTSHLAFGEGADLPAALIAAANGSRSFVRPAIEAATVALFPQAWLADPASACLSNAHHDVPWDDLGVLRACVAMAPQTGTALSLQYPANMAPLAAANSQLLTIP